MKKTANIYKTESGSYRARKHVHGVRISKNFMTIKAAKAWLMSLN